MAFDGIMNKLAEMYCREQSEQSFLFSDESQEFSVGGFQWDYNEDDDDLFSGDEFYLGSDDPESDPDCYDEGNLRFDGGAWVND